MRYSLIRLSAVILTISGCLIGGNAGAAETFCVDDAKDGAKEWSEAKDLNGTIWHEKNSDVLRLFHWKPVADGKFLWKPGTELGLFWQLPEALWTGVPPETEKKLAPLQFLTVTLEPAEGDAVATVSFDRTVVKLTDTGEYRDDLTQTWKYVLQFSDDCRVLSGRITVLKFNETESNLTAATSLVRAE